MFKIHSNTRFPIYYSHIDDLIFAVIYILTGFIEGAKTLTELKFYNWEGGECAVFGIQLHSIIIPFGIMIICTILFVFLYNLTSEKIEENRKKLKEM